MSYKIFCAALALCALPMAAMADSQVANHLVLSEMAIAVPSGFSGTSITAEYVEIYNPTNAAVDISKYYVSDYRLYFELPAVVSNNTNNQLSGTSDWLLQFPNGTSIPAGGVVVVTGNASRFLDLYFNGNLTGYTSQAGAPQLFEVHDSTSAVPNMISYNLNDPNYPLTVDRGFFPVNIDSQGVSHTDAGEFTVLFYWDGVGPVVKDVDIVAWRPMDTPWGSSDDQFPAKSGYPAIGPNGIPSSYPFDMGLPGGIDIDYTRAGSAVRRTLVEAGEASNTTPGATNGLTGHDESMELVNLTWEMVWGYPHSASPGLVPASLGRTTDDHAPVIGRPTRNIQSPAPGQAVTISCPVYGVAPFNVNLMVKKGTGNYVSQPMTATGGSEIFTATISTAGMAEGSHVEWYVTASKGTKTSTEEDFISQRVRSDDYRLNHTFMVKSTPYTANDLLVSEIMIDPQGSNNNTHVQYFELYNPSTQPMDISSFYWTIDYADGSNAQTVPQSVRMPDGAIIPPKGYALITARTEKFLRNYPGIDVKLIGDADLAGAAAFIPYAGAEMYFMDSNQYDFTAYDPVDIATAPDRAFKKFTYKSNVDGWPNHRATASPARDKGYAIELRSLNPGDDNIGSNWGIGTVYNGTPLAPNSLNPVVHAGNVTVTNVFRPAVYPAPSAPITIAAQVTSANSIDASTGVKLYYSTGGAFASVPMVLDAGSTFTGTLPGFPDGSLVKYYIEATDASGNKGAYPYTAPVTVVPFRVDASPQQIKDSLVINEVMYDPYGRDNQNLQEYIEFYNKGSQAIDLSFYMYGPNISKLDDPYANTFPEGTILQPGEFLVAVAQRENFTQQYLTPYVSTLSKYGNIHSAKVVQAGWNFGYNGSGSTLGNGDTTVITVAHINEVDFYGGSAASPFISLNYQVSAPWPANGEAIDGPSIELKNPSLSMTDPASWAVSLEPRGTPGVKNSTLVPSSSVNDWTLY